MSINISSNFDLFANLPLDERTVVADLTARDAIDSGKRYEGMQVYVESEELYYQLIGGVANSNWTASTAVYYIPWGGKQTSVHAGLLGETSIDDDYLYVCVQAGSAGSAIWKRVLLTQSV